MVAPLLFSFCGESRFFLFSPLSPLSSFRSPYPTHAGKERRRDDEVHVRRVEGKCFFSLRLLQLHLTFFRFLTLPYYLFSGESLGFSAHSKGGGRPLLWREVAILFTFPLLFSPDRIPLLFTTPINPWMPPTLLLLPLLLQAKEKEIYRARGSFSLFFSLLGTIRCLYREVEIFFDLCSSTLKACLWGKEAFFFPLEKMAFCALLQKIKMRVFQKISSALREHL